MYVLINLMILMSFFSFFKLHNLPWFLVCRLIMAIILFARDLSCAERTWVPVPRTFNAPVLIWWLCKDKSFLIISKSFPWYIFVIGLPEANHLDSNVRRADLSFPFTSCLQIVKGSNLSVIEKLVLSMLKTSQK